MEGLQVGDWSMCTNACVTKLHAAGRRIGDQQQQLATMHE
jgi:hypothetical protein